MPIETKENPMTGEEVVIVSGCIEKVYFNELKNRKTYTFNGKAWTPTHAINIVVDGIRIGLGLTDKEVVRGKKGDGWVDLAPGLEVRCVCEPNGEYNGVKQWSTKPSLINVTGGAASRQATKSQQKGGGFDLVGVHTGHALLGGATLLARKEVTSLVEGANKYHDISRQVEDWYSQGVGLKTNSRDIGIRCGNAVNVALKYTKLPSLFEEACRILEHDLAVVTSHVKGEDVKTPSESQSDFDDDVPF